MLLMPRSSPRPTWLVYWFLWFYLSTHQGMTTNETIAREWQEALAQLDDADERLKRAIDLADLKMSAYAGGDPQAIVDVVAALLRSIPVPAHLEPLIDGAIEMIRRVVAQVSR